ncbi:MAG TPA: ABC transporter substrate-binding protein [Mycobacteriales bacterium]|nr:ABC transporter substrate-binding protein [Mycobacteriales bacterium]
MILAGCASGSSGGTPKAAGSSGSSSQAPSNNTNTSTTVGAYGTLPAASGTPVKGGTITYPIINGSTPTYIMPILPGADSTVYNQQFEELLYRPLYWFDVGNRPVINYPLSIGKAPVYSDGDKTVTVTMNPNYKWTDGASVDAQDVLFWIDELRAAVHPVKTDAANFGNYTPGDFPDNVDKASAPSKFTFVLHLTHAYNPNWFTETQLNLITPLPSTTWAQDKAGGTQLDYTNPANAKKIANFLEAQSGKLSTYASNPLWKDVDGPFTLTKFDSGTDANTMTANPAYGGPQKPVFQTLQALYFASSTAQFDAVRAGKLDLGEVSSDNLPQVPIIKRLGYNVYGYPGLGFQYTVFNFQDKTNHWKNIVDQLYFRQAIAHLQDEDAIIKGVYGGAAAAAYGPVPAVPATAYVPSDASTNPYPYSIQTASQLLSSHGWKVVPGGTTTCIKPGSGAGECGAGIPAGQNLNFTDYYTNDPASAGLQTTQLASAAAQVGIKVTPVAKTFNFIVDQYDDPIAPSNNNKWQVEFYGGFTEGAYPTTDTIFNTGGSNNEGDYSNKQADKLINDSKFSSNPNAVQDEASYLTKNLPAVFDPNPDLIYAWKGISGPPDSFSNLTQYGFTPEYWYLTSGS